MFSGVSKGDIWKKWVKEVDKRENTKCPITAAYLRKERWLQL